MNGVCFYLNVIKILFKCHSYKIYSGKMENRKPLLLHEYPCFSIIARIFIAPCRTGYFLIERFVLKRSG